jgi:hypothetical protein
LRSAPSGFPDGVDSLPAGTEAVLRGDFDLLMAEDA